MKHRPALFLGILLCITIFAFCLAACNPNDDDKTTVPEDDNTDITYLSKEELYFAAGCDYILIENYFNENGVEYNNSYTITSTKDYGVFSTGHSIKYIPEDKEFEIIFVYTENESNTNLGVLYQYVYKGGIQVKLNQPLTEAKYFGEYEHSAIGITSSQSAYYIADFTFGDVKYLTLTDISDFNDIRCSGQIVYADNWQSASSMFDKDYSGAKCYERIEGCLNVLDELFKQIDNSYKIAGKFISPDECDHIAVTDIGFEATCTEEGLTDGSHCKLCNTILTEREVIPAKGHTPITDKGYPATCTEDGLTDGTHCVDCGSIITEQFIIPASHHYVNRECTVCHKWEPSDGLEFSMYYLSGYGQCYGVSGIGSCTDKCIVIPETYNNIPVRVIGSNAIKGNTLIEKLVMYNNIVSIKANAFNGCINLMEIELPETIEEISNSSFYNCGYYNNVSNWGADVLYIGDYLIEAKNAIIGIYNVKDGTRLIADSAFRLCEGVTEIYLPDSVLYIGDSSFSDCTALATIRMSNNLIGVGAHSFENCKIGSVFLPKTLRYYYSDSNIKIIDYAGTVAEWNSVNKNGDDAFIGVTINCSNGTV